MIKAKIYRFFAIIFAVMGAVIFMLLYFRHLDGRMMEALTDIRTVFIVLIPFLPAITLASLAARTESKFYNIAHSSGTTDDDKPKKKGD